MTPRFIIAKYVPDLSRMEPKNIGVFLWSKGEIRARFLEDDDAQFVNEPDTFQRWKKYWLNMIQGKAIRPRRGKPVSTDDPECMKALLSTQEGNYILVDAGELLEMIGKREITKATDFLFSELVATKEVKKQLEKESLESLCRDVMQKSGISIKKEYRTNYPVLCTLYGQAHRPMHFNYGLVNGSPRNLFQRVSLQKEMSVNNAVLTLRAVIDNGIVEQNHCAVLTQSTSIKSNATEKNFEWLQKICPVIDLDSTEATVSLKEIVQAAELKAGH